MAMTVVGLGLVMFEVEGENRGSIFCQDVV